MKINAAGLDDKAKVAEFIAQGNEILAKATKLEAEILAIVEGKISK